MTQLKNLWLLLLSLLLASCEGICSNTSSVASRTPLFDRLKSFSFDFPPNELVVIDKPEVVTITTRNTLGLCSDSRENLIHREQKISPILKNVDITDNIGHFSANSHISINTTPGALRLPENFSLNFWLNPTAAGVVISGIGFEVLLDEANNLSIGEKSNVKLTTAIALNTWQFISIVKDGSNFSLAINAGDGQKISNFFPFPFSIHGIGEYNDGFQGSLDKIAFIDRALSTEAIDTIYQDSKGEYEALNNALGWR